MKAKDKQGMQAIDELVFRFQAGDKEAGEEVMRMFGCHPEADMSNYVGKYYYMLRMGRFSFDDLESRTFINCFIGNAEVRSAMRKWFQSADTRRHAVKALTDIVKRLWHISDEELKQDLRLLFIQQMQRYKKIKKNVYFSGYLCNSYGFAVVDYVMKRMKSKEPYVIKYNTYQIIPMQEEVYVDDASSIDINERTLYNTPMMLDDDELGNSWVRGLTCGEEFMKLNHFQRLILKLYYQDDMSDGKIAKLMNMHINTIHNHRKRAIKIVEQEAIRISKEGYQ